LAELLLTQTVTIEQHMTTTNKTAILFGATGLVGSELLGMLEQDSRYSKIKVFGRSKPKFTSEKVEVSLGDLRNPERLSVNLTGHDLFICLGTTIKVAGSREEFRRIDLELPAKVAAMARANGVETAIVISSLGANPTSNGFYLRTKGEMEQQIMPLGFEKLAFMHPSLLLGDRAEFRLGEVISKNAFKVLGFMFTGKLRRYRPVQASAVAAAMLQKANEAFTGVAFVESEAI